MQFSILIPVYNAEKYLAACLHSILPQIGPEDEIILCDDASTDNSLAICKEFAEQYPNSIRIIANKKNQRVLMTRRHLFASAKAQYFLFVDADDELTADALPALRNAIALTDADMIVFNAECIHLDSSTELFKPLLTADHLYTGEEKTAVYEALFQNNYLNSLCTKVVKRSILDESIDYSPWKELSIGEDLFQSLPLFDRAQTIYYLDQSLYKYLKRERSITTGGQKNLYANRLILWPWEDQYFASWKLSRETLDRCYRKRCNEIINHAVKMASAQDYKAFSSEMKRIVQDGFFSRAWEQSKPSGRYRWYGRILLEKRICLAYTAFRLEAWAAHFLKGRGSVVR